MNQTRKHSSRLPTLVAILAILVMAFAPSSDAEAQQMAKVQRPVLKDKAQNKDRSRAIRAGRRQRVSPQRRTEMAAKLTAQAKKLGAGKLLKDASFRDALSRAPLQARLEVFKAMVAGRGNGQSVQTFNRRMRGMLRAGKKNNVAKAKKTFFEVTPETLDLFTEVMGQNVVWFNANSSPGHLHTLLADQGGNKRLTHNTYGDTTYNEASIGQYTQYSAPVVLTDKQMDRFVRYLNAGLEHKRGGGTYGFKTSKGAWQCQTRCTNWATSAPVGDKLRWVRTVDRRVMKAAGEGKLGAEFKDGLHAALAAAPDKAARDALVAKVRIAGVSKWTRSSARRLGKEFNIHSEKFPNRPKDLVGRESLSQTIGLNRSQDPAKWMYDLFMSKKVPIIGVMQTTSAGGEFKKMEFNMEIMGKIDASGRVVKNGNQDSHGVIPEGRSSVQPAAQGSAE